MKYKIHFEIDGVSDCFEIEGATSKEIYEKTLIKTKERGLEDYKNNLWSEKCKE